MRRVLLALLLAVLAVGCASPGDTGAPGGGEASPTPTVTAAEGPEVGSVSVAAEREGLFFEMELSGEGEFLARLEGPGGSRFGEVNASRSPSPVGPLWNVSSGRYEASLFREWSAEEQGSGTRYTFRDEAFRGGFDVAAEDMGGTTEVFTVEEQGNPWRRDVLRVHVNGSSAPERKRGFYVDGVERAMDWWEEGGNGRLAYSPRFETVEDPGEADVTVTWVRDVEAGEEVSRDAVGVMVPREARYRSPDGVWRTLFLSAEVEMDYLIDGVTVSGSSMETVAKHELGHALGLGHVEGRGSDVMNPEVLVQ